MTQWKSLQPEDVVGGFVAVGSDVGEALVVEVVGCPELEGCLGVHGARGSLSLAGGGLAIVVVGVLSIIILTSQQD